MCAFFFAANIEQLLRHSTSFGPSAPIAYATSVSPPNEAVTWPGCRCPMGDKAVAWQGRRHNLARQPLLHHREEIGKNLKSTRKPHTELLVEEGEEDSILFCNFGGKM